MQIDKQTLKDIEFFLAEEERTVFDFIDKTKTTEGRYRLREMFLHPPDCLENLKIQQNSVCYLAENSDSFVMPFTDRQMKSIEEYISSNIDIIDANNFFDCIKFCIVDIQAYRFLKYSVNEAVVFLNELYGFLEKRKGELPAILQKTFLELDFVIHNGGFKKIIALLNQKAFSFYSILQADRILRTDLKTSLVTIINYYYQIDALLAMAKTTNEYNFNFPEFKDNGDCYFKAEGLYHPMLTNAVPSNVKMDNESNFIFLTGPNMSGKTTFLKATALAVLFAHVGMGVPAKNMELSYFDRLFTSLNITDSILSGYSYFLSEVKRVRELAEALSNGEKVFSLCDELFRGTNVKDAYDATVMVISGLTLWRNSIFVLSSHLCEVWGKIEHFSNVRSLYFESEINDGAPVFTYRLISGISDMRLGLKIIENEKIMELLKHQTNKNNYENFRS